MQVANGAGLKKTHPPLLEKRPTTKTPVPWRRGNQGTQDEGNKGVCAGGLVLALSNPVVHPQRGGRAEADESISGLRRVSTRELVYTRPVVAMIAFSTGAA